MNLSLKARASWLAVTLSLMALLAVGGLSLNALDSSLKQRALAEIKVKHQQLESYIQQQDNDVRPLALVSYLEQILPKELGWQFVVFDEAGDQFYASNSTLFKLKLSDLPADPGVKLNLGPIDYLSYYQPGQSPWQLVVLQNVDKQQQIIHRINLVFGLSLILILPGLGLLSWWFAKQALKPFKRFKKVITKVNCENLEPRVELNTIPPELRELGKSFNVMMDRLEPSFQRMAQYSADIAHELQAPVRKLVVNTQHALKQGSTALECQVMLNDHVNELRRIERTIADMLFLAKADQGWLVAQSEKVDLLEEAARAVEHYKEMADERNVQVEVSGEAQVRGDEVMLCQAVSNLLSNAIRHANAGSCVYLRINQTSHKAWIEVENQGPDIPQDHQQYIFNRFYRADVKSKGGIGLGLAITRSIIKAHGGEIDFTSQGGVTIFRIWLPLQGVQQDH